MKLFDDPASPFCRKVRVLSIEAGLDAGIELAVAQGTVLDSSKMPTQANPLGKIPTLVLEDGTALFDSRVICRHLDRLADGRFYPEDRLFEVLTTEALADGIMDAAVLMVYEKRCRPEALWSSDWLEGQWAKITRALDHLEAHPMTDSFDMGHIAVACALGYLDFRHADRNWRDQRPGLAAWFDRVLARPSISQTVPA